MCGIVGQLAFGKLSEEEEKVRRESMIFLGSELLQLTQERGKDATGVSLLFDDGNYMGLKMGIPSIDFISRYGKTNKEYGGFIKVWRESELPARVFLGHCRSTTRGNSLDNVNNHPVKVGDIIGIHNGTLTNDDKIFTNLKCKRDGMVDSEAIFRLLHHFSKNGTEPFTTKMLEEVVTRLTGTFAVLAYSGNNPYQVCAFRDGRPLELALVKPLKLVVCASDKKFIETALFRYNKHINLYINGPNFPTLTKSDIEYKFLLDDSALVFDLRTEINKDTDINDLYDYEKMPRTKVKCYDKFATTTTTIPASAGNSNFKNSTGAPSRTSCGGVNGDSSIRNQARNQAGFNLKRDASSGRVWSKKNNKYEMVGTDEEVKESAKMSAVEIDIETGKVTDLNLSTGGGETAGKGKFALENRGKDMETSMVPGNPAKIEEVKVEAKAAPAEEKIDTTEIHTLEVDVTVDAEAIGKAEELAKSEAQYENDEEVLEALEIVDKDTLQSLPITALANRMKKYIIKQGIVKGYKARKAEEQRPGHKTSAAEAHIRVSKAMVRTLVKAIEKSHKKIPDDLIETAVIEVLEEGSELTKSMLDKIFKAGDERENEIIAKIKRIVGDKENR